MWTYQEILLASNPILVSANDQISWTAFTFGIAFLEYSGVIYKEQPHRATVLGRWIKLALSREHIQSTITGRSTWPLRMYIKFFQRILMSSDRFREFFPKFTFVPAFLAIVILVSLSSIFPSDYRTTQIKLKENENFRNCLNSIVHNVMASYTSTEWRVSNSDGSVRTTYIPPPKHTITSQTTGECRSTGTIANSQIFLIGGSLYNNIEPIINEWRTEVVSEARGCHSQCFSRSNLHDCFASCHAEITGIPTAISPSFKDADSNNTTQSSYLAVFTILGLLFAFIALVATIVILIFIRRWKSPLRYIHRPAFDTVNLIDGISSTVSHLVKQSWTTTRPLLFITYYRGFYRSKLTSQTIRNL